MYFCTECAYRQKQPCRYSSMKGHCHDCGGCFSSLMIPFTPDDAPEPPVRPQDKALALVEELMSAQEANGLNSGAAKKAKENLLNHVSEKPALNPDMPAQELRLHMGEMTSQEERTARAAIRWANSQRAAGLDEITIERNDVILLCNALTEFDRSLARRSKTTDDGKTDLKRRTERLRKQLLAPKQTEGK